MIAKFVSAVVATLAFVVVVPARAERTQFNAKDVVIAKPGMSYIYYRADSKALATFLRTVDETQRAEYVAKRTVALAKAHASYVRKKATWDAADPAQRPGQEPVEPTEETFAFAAPEIENFISVNSGRVIVDAKPHYGYLMMVKPGEYTYYGPMIVGPEGALGTCMCMGSVRFQAPVNAIVDLGEIATVSAQPDRAAGGPIDKTALAVHVAFHPGVTPTPLPSNLPKLPVVQARFHAAYKIQNYHGIVIDRLLPIPGVLEYRRDEVVDLAAPESPSSPLSR